MPISWCAAQISDTVKFNSKYTYLQLGTDTRSTHSWQHSADKYYDHASNDTISIGGYYPAKQSIFQGVYFKLQFSLIDALLAQRKSKTHFKDFIAGELNIGYAQSYLYSITNGIWASYKYYVGFACFYNFNTHHHIGAAIFPIEIYRDFVSDYGAGSAYHLWYKYHKLIIDAGLSSYSRMYFAMFNFLETNNMDIRMLAGVSYMINSKKSIGIGIENMSPAWANYYINAYAREYTWRIKLNYTKYF
ncbi:MAG: hypothetical protein NW207_08520 [Cytophagales bacterium]|nr:hypothetical protein [Cytophagales bacterium]